MVFSNMWALQNSFKLSTKYFLNLDEAYGNNTQWFVWVTAPRYTCHNGGNRCAIGSMLPASERYWPCFVSLWHVTQLSFNLCHVILKINQYQQNGTAWIILCMGSANETRCYIVTSSLIGWAHTQNDTGSAVPMLGQRKFPLWCLWAKNLNPKYYTITTVSGFIVLLQYYFNYICMSVTTRVSFYFLDANTGRWQRLSIFCILIIVLVVVDWYGYFVYNVVWYIPTILTDNCWAIMMKLLAYLCVAMG